MNDVVKTNFVGRNPFKSKPAEVDISTLKIVDDQPKQRIAKNYKYDPLFKGLEIGKAIACKSADCDKVAQAVRAYASRHNKPWKIKAQMYYTKTTARIFVLELK